MNFVELLKFIPLIIGGYLAFHLIFSVQLPKESIGKIVTYFLGILIVFLAVSWLITTFLPDFANDLLDSGRDSPEWNTFIQNSEAVVDDAFSGITNDGNTGDGGVIITPVGTAVQIIVVTPTVPANGGINVESAGSTRIHTVVFGDTLSSLSRLYGVPVDSIRAANGIAPNNDLIHPGQQLIIPAQ